MILSLSICTSAGLFGQTLRVAYKENPPFYQFTDKNGESQGLNVEIIKAIAQNSGDVLIFFPKERLSECLELLESGKVDIVLGVSSAANGDFSATMETSTSTLSVMADKEFAKLYASKLVKDYTVSFEYNTANTAIIPSFLASEFYVTGNQLELLKNNLIGRGDVMICDKECMLYILRQQGIEDNYTNIQNNIGVIGYTMIVKPGNTTLLRSLNEGIMGLRVDGTYEKIISSWVIEEDNLSQKWLIIIEIVFITLAFFVLGVAIYVYVSTGIRKYLRREVALKTVELDKQVFQLEKEKGLRDGMIQRSPLGMALLDTNGHVMSINPSACRLTGLKSVDVKTSIRTMPLFGEIFATHDTMKYPIEDETIRIMGKDNLVRSYRYSIRRIVEGDTQSDILMTLEDITVDEEKKLATIEREKNRILNQMMAGIAHEVKNPLTGIRNFAQLIPTCYTDPDFMENFTKLVPQEVDRISRLIESLMHYAR
ncbi:MAG: transporter substrate-binding domain-containing protein, partial [Sphaerochaetaceae bacterium]|nr:transporter substrate-binding domain-containing protein [Sphaerochaetaceae bacterium]